MKLLKNKALVSLDRKNWGVLFTGSGLELNYEYRMTYEEAEKRAREVVKDGEAPSAKVIYLDKVF